jgi:hypothetical protein
MIPGTSALAWKVRLAGFDRLSFGAEHVGTVFERGSAVANG